MDGSPVALRRLGPYSSRHQNWRRWVVLSALAHLAVFLPGRSWMVWSTPAPPKTPPLHVRLVSSGVIETRPTAKSSAQAGADRQDDPIPSQTALDPSGALDADPALKDPLGAMRGAGPDTPRRAPVKPPKNMDGPDDCLSKVVAKICPSADLQCLADYNAFCAAVFPSVAMKTK